MMPETNMVSRIVYTTLLLFTALAVLCYAGDSEDNIDCGTAITTNAFPCCNFTAVFMKWVTPQKKCRAVRTDCDYMKCQFREVHWMENKETVNITAVSDYLADWASNHAEWKDALNVVAKECLPPHRSATGTEQHCEPVSVSLCIANNLFKACPLAAKKNTPDCEYLRAYALKCGPEFEVFH